MIMTSYKLGTFSSPNNLFLALINVKITRENIEYRFRYRLTKQRKRRFKLPKQGNEFDK